MGANSNFSSLFHKSFRPPTASVRLLSAAHGELQYLCDSWDGVLLSAEATSSHWKIKPEFTEKYQRSMKKFHDELKIS